MTRAATGWTIFLAAIGMMATFLAVDVSKFQSWSDATTPGFVGACLGHFGVVIAAFVAGKLMPIDPMQGGRRGTDPKPPEDK